MSCRTQREGGKLPLKVHCVKLGINKVPAPAIRREEIDALTDYFTLQGKCSEFGEMEFQIIIQINPNFIKMTSPNNSTCA